MFKHSCFVNTILDGECYNICIAAAPSQHHLLIFVTHISLYRVCLYSSYRFYLHCLTLRIKLICGFKAYIVIVVLHINIIKYTVSSVGCFIIFLKTFGSCWKIINFSFDFLFLRNNKITTYFVCNMTLHDILKWFIAN